MSVLKKRGIFTKRAISTKIQGAGRSGPYRKPVFFGMYTTAVLSAVVIILLSLLLVPGAHATGTKTAFLGDMVLLSGYSPGSDTVYLFMTGPNLPVNGVALNNINRRADMGGLSTASADPDGHWEYKWYTSQLGGKIDTGTYTIWVTDRPVDRSHLSGSDYRTITVLLQPPGISAEASTATGAVNVSTIPGGATLFIDGENRGKTPVSIPDLDIGSHVLIVSSPGFGNLTTQVVVTEGAVSEVTIPLRSVNGSAYVNTTPPGAEISIDGILSGVSPVLLTDLEPGNHTVVAKKVDYNITSQEIRVIGGHMVVVQMSISESRTAGVPVPPVTRAAGLLPFSVACSVLLLAIHGLRKRS